MSWGFVSELLQGFITLKRGVVDAGNEGAQSGVIVEGAELVCNVHKLFDLLCSVSRFIVTKDERSNPTCFSDGTKVYEHRNAYQDAR